MSGGFAPDWLAARDPYDVAALDRQVIEAVRAWAEREPPDRELCLVDLGCGTGSGLRRALGWVAGRPVRAYAVDSDPNLLGQLTTDDPSATPHAGPVQGAWRKDHRPADAQARERPARRVTVTPVVSDVFGQLEAAGGPADGSVDLVVSHAVADLLPLDRFAVRVAALLRPGGLAHLGLTYDGETRFSPTDDPDLDRRVIAAYHRHMDRSRERDPAHGGSTAGQRLTGALTTAGLVVLRSAPSVWDVRASDGPGGHAVLAGLIGFVVESLSELGEPPVELLGRWERARRAALDASVLRAHVRHLDVLARRPGPE